MSKIKIAEIFHSLQGEGLYVGQPSVFVRTFGCNFTCAGFGLKEGWKSNEADKIAEVVFKEKPDVTYGELPLTKTGCDSYASWHPKFKSLSPVMSTDAIVHEMEIERMSNSIIAMPNFLRNDGTTHLVLTGGEPLLGWQRSYPDFFAKAFDKGYRHITIETNGTQKISDDFANFLLKTQITVTKSNSLTFSVSPKLSCSGEPVEKALQPDIVVDYQKYGTVYLKFVVATETDMHDAVKFVTAYRKAGFRGEVYIMPCGGDPEMYNLNAPAVASMAMRYGYRYSPRLQVDLWQNEWGT